MRKLLAPFKMRVLLACLWGGLLLGLGSPVYGQEESADLESLRDAYRRIVDKREATIEEMESIETTYNELADDLDRLKSSGEPNRNKVKRHLRRSQTLTDRLETLDQRIDKIDQNIETLREQLVSRIDEAISTNESRLADVSLDQRQTLVDRLNELRKLQSTYESPLPEAPDPREITETLRMARELDGKHPDRMEAAAAELKDTESQVRKRLKAVESKLEELEKTKTLARRSEMFQSEESFFDEANRPHVVGRHETSDSSSNSNDTSGGGGEASPGDSSGDDTSSGPTLDAPEQSNESSAGGGGEPSGTGSGGREAPSRGVSPDQQDSPGGGRVEVGDENSAPVDRAEAAPRADGSPESGNDNPTFSGDASEGSEASVVFEREADLSTAVDSEDDEDDSTLDTRIDKLEEERERLEEQAEKLEDKAKTLQRRARELDEFDP